MIGSDTSCGGTADLIRAKYTCHHWPTVHLDRTKLGSPSSYPEGHSMKPSPRDADITHVKLSKEPQQLQQPVISYNIVWEITNTLLKIMYNCSEVKLQNNLAVENIWYTDTSQRKDKNVKAWHRAHRGHPCSQTDMYLKKKISTTNGEYVGYS